MKTVVKWDSDANMVSITRGVYTKYQWMHEYLGVEKLF